MSLRNSMKIVLLVLGVAFLAANISANGAEAKYTGASKCKTCHLPQHKTWLAAKHSKALEALPEKDRTNAECLACHSTGYGKEAMPGTDLGGVQCEACHGPGSEYKSMKIMSKKAYMADPDAAHKAALAAGLIIPDENTCKTCHNPKSPTFKGFDFAAAKEKIKHWD